MDEAQATVLTLIGRTLHGTWEICRDGSTWAKDFDITYTRR
ncbi:MAG: hypothetical protein ACYDDW_18980 [Dermatophilaceae bacterium]